MIYFLRRLDKARLYTGAGIALFFLLILFLRLFRLGCHDFWFDEVGSVEYAVYPWANWNAPLYWIVLHFWIKIFGISEFSLRFPSAVFSFLSVVLVFLLGRKLFDARAGFIASIFTGLSPFHLWYAQEARDYSMALFLGVLSSLLFLKAIKERNFKAWLFFILVSILGLYTNYFYILLLSAQGLYFAVVSKKMRLTFKETIYFLIVPLSFIFYLPRFIDKFHYIRSGFWLDIPQKRALLTTLENFILGYNGTTLLYLGADILCVVFFISACRVFSKKKELRPGFVFCLFLLLIPVVSAFFFSKVFFPVYLDRGLILFTPYLYLILSLGIVHLRKPAKVVFLVVLVVMFFMADYRFFKDSVVGPMEHRLGAYVKRPIRPAVEFLQDNLKKGDIVGFTSTSAIPSFVYYGSKKLRHHFYFFDPRFPDTDWRRPIQESRFCVPLDKIDRLSFRRLWVVFSQGAVESGFDANSRSVRKWLDDNFKPEYAKKFEGLWIILYVRS